MRASSALLVALLVLVAAVSQVAADGYCRALAMSGGGDKAAYEAGVLRGLLSNLDATETSYNVVTGISAGSTLTAAFSVFPVGAEDDAVDFVYQIITDLNQSSIFREWPGGLIDGLLHHPSLFDSTPLRNLMENVLSDKTITEDRITCMGASNLRTGLFERFCNHTDMAHLVNHTIASAAIPGVFLDVTMESSVSGTWETYVDGGTLVNVDVIGAVEACLGMGFAESEIIVDTIECGGANITTLTNDPASMTTIPILLRRMAMTNYASRERDYVAAVHAYPGVNFRYRILPTQPIPGTGIDFNPVQMQWMEQLGQADAKSAVFPPGDNEEDEVDDFAEE